MGGVFINYRRADSGANAVLIYDRLTRWFGKKRVFLDFQTIPTGTDFVEVLPEGLRACSVMLVVIGPGWLTLTNEAGQRRIDDPQDWVRREIADALSNKLLVIPVLTGDAKPPTEQNLPEDIAGLARRQYVHWHHRSTDPDLAHLVERIIAADPELAEVAAWPRWRKSSIETLEYSVKAIKSSITAVKKLPGPAFSALLLLKLSGMALVVAVAMTMLRSDSRKPTHSSSTPTTSVDSPPTTSISPLAGCAPKQGLTVEGPKPRPSVHVPSLPIVRSFTAPGRDANGLTFDGEHLWVSDNSSTLFKIDLNGDPKASHQAPQPTPEGITWDGQALWLFTTNHGEIYKFCVADGGVHDLGKIDPPAEVVGGGITHDMTWDGSSLWWAEEYNVYRLDANGHAVGSFAKNDSVVGLEWDGSYLWLAFETHSDLAYAPFQGGAKIVVTDRDGKEITTFQLPIFELTALARANGKLLALGSDGIGQRPKIYEIDTAPLYGPSG